MFFFSDTTLERHLDKVVEFNDEHKVRPFWPLCGMVGGVSLSSPFSPTLNAQSRNALRRLKVPSMELWQRL